MSAVAAAAVDNSVDPVASLGMPFFVVPQAVLSSAKTKWCNFSSAKEGNLLEAVNMALNDFERHYVDRTLAHAGQSPTRTLLWSGAQRIGCSLLLGYCLLTMLAEFRLG